MAENSVKCDLRRSQCKKWDAHDFLFHFVISFD